MARLQPFLERAFTTLDCQTLMYAEMSKDHKNMTTTIENGASAFLKRKNGPGGG